MRESSDKQQTNLSADGMSKTEAAMPSSTELLTSNAHTERFWKHCGDALSNINPGQAQKAIKEPE